MSERVIPISDMNAIDLRLDRLARTRLKLGSPACGQTIFMGVLPQDKAKYERVELNAIPNDYGSGFSIERDDAALLQAQDIRRGNDRGPVFEAPISALSISRNELETWQFDLSHDEVADIDGLLYLVWAVATYGLDGARLQRKSAERPLVSA